MVGPSGLVVGPSGLVVGPSMLVVGPSMLGPYGVASAIALAGAGI